MLNDAGGDWLAVAVKADLDDGELTGDRFVGRSVFHQLGSGEDHPLAFPFDGELSVDRPGQAAVPTRPGSVDAAMVDDDDGAVELLAQAIGGATIGGHIFVS